MLSKKVFDPDCKSCKRLVNYLSEVKFKYPEYHCAPVASFGDKSAQLLIVGLAPGLHGANACGRPFTGDTSGILLYKTLFDFGFSNQTNSDSLKDGLELKNCQISNAVKCLPPNNKPTAMEINQCNHFLTAEIKGLIDNAVIMVLGSIAHQSVLKAYGLKLSTTKFGHNKAYELPDGKMLISSYHCSRYNIQTKRLTDEMFADVFKSIRNIIN